jgi:hypothetical protein
MGGLIMSRCQNCGHENDNDAGFCEKCGTNLKNMSDRTIPTENVKNGSMAQSTKILIVFCIILVAGLGITTGALMQMNKPLVLNTTNNTTPTVNTSITQNQSIQTTTKNTSSKEITADQAATIARKYGKKSVPEGQWSVGSVDFVPAANYENTPNYMIELSNNAPDAENTTGTSMDVRVNGVNGAIMK